MTEPIRTGAGAEANTGTQSDVSEEAFAKIYGETPVPAFKGVTMPLRRFMELEAMFCEADESKREDPQKRVAFLAARVGREALLPEHQHLVPPPEETE